jgi:regulatory protein
LSTNDGCRLSGEDIKKITGITQQVRNTDRVNVAIDGRYALSLTVRQVVDLGLKVGQEVSDERMEELRGASEYGKVYQRALEYALMRPRSVKEVKDYLWKKTLDKRLAGGGVKRGVSEAVVNEVLERLIDVGYVDDVRFAEYWVGNRMQRKGVSQRRLRMELMKKGVDSGVVEVALLNSVRDEREEMRKIIAKKRQKYTDDKLVAYLVGQGFGYALVKEVIKES